MTLKKYRHLVTSEQWRFARECADRLVQASQIPSKDRDNTELFICSVLYLRSLIHASPIEGPPARAIAKKAADVWRRATQASPSFKKDMHTQLRAKCKALYRKFVAKFVDTLVGSAEYKRQVALKSKFELYLCDRYLETKTSALLKDYLRAQALRAVRQHARA